MKVAINGFGRIGRCFLRTTLEDKDFQNKFEIVAIKLLIQIISVPVNIISAITLNTVEDGAFLLSQFYTKYTPRSKGRIDS